MTTVIVVCEGRTEAAFVQNLLQPPLAHGGIYMEPRLISTSSRARGGALDIQRVRRYLRNTLRERRDTRIGLHRIRAECRHFDRWLTCIEGLPALASMA